MRAAVVGAAEVSGTAVAGAAIGVAAAVGSIAYVGYKGAWKRETAAT